jgi:hypothetical protein
MRFIVSSNVRRRPNQLSPEAESNSCPQCGGTMSFVRRHPILTRHLSSSPDKGEKGDRLRYVPAWVCENATCSFFLVISDQ